MAVFKASKKQKSVALVQGETDYIPYLPFLRHVDDEIIALTDCTYMRMYRLSGISFETSDADTLMAWHNSLNILFRSIFDDRLSMWTHLVRRRIDVPMTKGFRSGFAADLNDQYNAKLSAKNLYENQFYVTLLVKPADLIANKLKGKGSELDLQSIEVLNDKCRDFEAQLAKCAPKVLKAYERNGVMFSEPLEALHYILSGEDKRIPVVCGPIGQALYCNRVIFKRNKIETHLDLRTDFAGIFGIREYVAHTFTGQFNNLLALNFEFVLTQSYTSFVKADALDKMTQKSNQMVSSDDKAQSQAEALIDGMDAVMSNEFVMGDHHLSLMVRNSKEEVLDTQLSLARAAMADSGMVMAREDFALEAAYWAQMPGNWQMRARPSGISSRNFAAFSPFYNYPHGTEKDNHWGDAVALLQTNAAGSYWFNFHEGDLGHTLIIGPSGGGKTVLQNFLMSQLEKMNCTQVFIDKDRGAEIFVRACGGTYLPLQNGFPTGFNPLKALQNEPGDIAFLQSLVRVLVRRTNQPFTVADENYIDNAINSVMRLDPSDRSFSAMRQMMGHSDAEGVGARLERWCKSGALGWVLDGDDDLLKLDARFMGFDMTDFLENPEVRTPVMMYLFHRIEGLLNGNRLVVDIDEFWKALEDDAFKAFAQDGLKTYRKRNAFLVFGTQSAADALRSSISHTIIEQTSTKILLPNPKAEEEAYCKGLGLTSAEFELIKYDLTPESRCFLIKKDNESVVAKLDLGGMHNALSVLSGRDTTLRIMEAAIAAKGTDPVHWLPEFYKNCRLS